MAQKGFVEHLLDGLRQWGAVQASRDQQGRPDPYRAAGMALGMKGDLSSADMLALGGLLGAEGAFDDAPAPDTASDDIVHAIAQYRSQLAKRNKALHQYWASTWRYVENAMHLPPTETAVRVWECVTTQPKNLPCQSPEYRAQFTAWLRKNHGIHMDADGRMHLIDRKKE